MTDTYHNAEGYFAMDDRGEPSEYYPTKRALRQAVEDGSAWGFQSPTPKVEARKPAIQPPLFEGLHWQRGQAGMFDAPMTDSAPVEVSKRKPDQEQYAEGYRAGLAGRKCRSSHPDYIVGHNNGTADRRYNQRTADAAKVFAGWTTLPGQCEMFS